MASSDDPPRPGKGRRAPKEGAPSGASLGSTAARRTTKGEPDPKREVKYAPPGDPNYLDPQYHPILAPGETWFQARRRQVDVIKAAETKLNAERAATAAAQQAQRAARRAHVEATTDIVNARKPTATDPAYPPATASGTSDGHGTVPFQDSSPLPVSDGVSGKAGRSGRRSERKAYRKPVLATGKILGAFSQSLRQTFPELIPLKPYCGNDLDEGIWIWPRQRALTCLHVQFNHPAIVRWLVLDIDRRGAYFADDDALLPAFNLVMVNPSNGHAHVAYILDVPVGRHDIARLKPLKLLAAVERGLTRRLGGDRGYAGLLAKNPLHPHWVVEWRRDAPYSLDVLAGWLSQEDMRPEPERTSFGLGRNCVLFDQLRVLAYREVLAFKRSGQSAGAWRSRLSGIARNMNRQFSTPLGEAEVRGIAKSVAKWTWKHFTEQGLSDIQSARARKRWAGHVAESTTKPWLAIGISRRTYYRRKAEEKLGKDDE